MTMLSQLTSFIGREVEMAEIQRLLQERRLVTLTGTGGSGKTRLAIEASAVLAPGFSDGIHFVDLATLTRSELVVETVARVIGVSEAPARENRSPFAEVIANFLRTRHALLVLDNCEHLLDECSRLCDELLSACANLRVLATSREPLGIAGESLFRVPLLSLPSLDPLPDLSALWEIEAIRLFVDRARLADPGFALTDGNARPVATVCVRLDGIPLAIELAAAALRALPLSELAVRLDQRFLLSTRDRTALPRHRTLQALLDWSYMLLDTRQQTVFHRLAVFAGEWTVEAAESVCTGRAAQGKNGAVAPEEVLDILMHLVDKSLVQLERDTSRYRMLETIRLYGLGKLENSGEKESTSHSHLAWCLDFVERGAERLGGPGQQEWILRLESELASLRAALAWAIETGHAEEAARLALALWKFWVARAYHREARRWLEQILALDTASRSSRLPAPVRARLLGNLGILAHTLNEFEQASYYHSEALRLWREQGDSVGITTALHDLGWQHFEAMDLDGARRYAEESLAMAREADDPAAVAAALNLFAMASVEAGHLDNLVPALEESLSIWRGLGALSEVASTLITLARVEQRLGNLERAGRLVMEGLRLQAGLGDYTGLIGYLVVMVYFAFDDGKPPRGTAPPGFQRPSYLDNGQLPHGHAPAAQVLGAMSAWHERVIGADSGQWYAHVLPILDKLRPEMGEAAFAREFAAGKAMDIEDIVALAGVLTRPAVALPAMPEINQENSHVRASDSRSAQPARRYPAGLTQREVEVLKLVAAGLTNAQTADRLTVTPRTINAHLTSIYSKTGVTGRTAAVRFAFDHGLA